jgi:hypothetical protein
MGALNTTTIAALSGTSFFPLGGDVRTTLGGLRIAMTWYPVSAVLLPERVMSTKTVSPTLADSAIGSNPPSTRATVTLAALRPFRIVALCPSATDPGGSETQPVSPTTSALAPELWLSGEDTINDGSRFTGRAEGPLDSEQPATSTNMPKISGDRLRTIRCTAASSLVPTVPRSS